MSNILKIIIAIGIFIVVWLIFVYNSLIKLKNRTQEAWSDINIQLKRRYNLIPNLVETVKGYAKHERELFEQVTRARTAAMDAKNPDEKAKAENVLSGTLKTLFAVSENYPKLKANENFLELQRELTDTEDKIQAARRFYNSNIRDFNIKIEKFPVNLIAGMLGFKKKEFFELEEKQAKEPVKVKF